MRRRSATQVLAWIVIGSVAALAISGCGGGQDSDEDNVRAAVAGYFGGLVSGDGGQACSHVATQGRIELAELAAISGIDSIDCAEIVEEIHGGIGPNDLDRLESIEVSRVAINGDRATATIDGATVRPTLAKADGGWLIVGGFLEGAGVPSR